MHLIQRLPDGPLDIIGDVHGEIDALLGLLHHLGYNERGDHPARRKLVFVGDLCDRGPDSHSVIQLVQRLVLAGNGQSILGNHEINLLTNDIKDGSGWFFDERHERDLKFYAPFRRTPPEQRESVRNFLQGLPIALYRDDLRVVHAAWTDSAIDALRSVPVGNIVQNFGYWDDQAQTRAQQSGLYGRYLDETKQWTEELENGSTPPPYLHSIAEYEATQQMINPFKVLTSGVEKKAPEPFFAGNRWRFSDRVNWWDDYNDRVPVVIGHYWRLFHARPQQTTPRYSQLFHAIDPTAWHGKHRNVFCVDFSVGARWRDRAAARPIKQSRYRLAALQWPENRLVFDSGEVLATHS